MRDAASGWREVPGRVHAVETAGAVDGPGVRYVVFTQGCPLRCLYCHNPDARATTGVPRTTAGAVVDDVARYARFLRTARGGLTVSGGEPLAQPAFTTALVEGARALGLHTALDTSGYGGDRAPEALLDATDLVLLDVKAWRPETYRRVTGVPLAPTLAFAERLAARGTPVWLRYVLVPGLTDMAEEVAGVAAFAARLGNVRRVDVLPFHQMGRHKWARLGLAYALAETPTPTDAQVAEAVARFAAEGLLAA